MTFAGIWRVNCQIQKSVLQHARFHTSFAQGVVDLNETQGKGGIHCLRLPEQLQKTDSLQQFGKNKKRLLPLSQANSSILHQQVARQVYATPQRSRQKLMPI